MGKSAIGIGLGLGFEQCRAVDNTDVPMPNLMAVGGCGSLHWSCELGSTVCECCSRQLLLRFAGVCKQLKMKHQLEHSTIFL